MPQIDGRSRAQQAAVVRRAGLTVTVVAVECHADTDEEPGLDAVGRDFR